MMAMARASQAFMISVDVFREVAACRGVRDSFWRCSPATCRCMAPETVPDTLASFKCPASDMVARRSRSRQPDAGQLLQRLGVAGGGAVDDVPRQFRAGG